MLLSLPPLCLFLLTLSLYPHQLSVPQRVALFPSDRGLQLVFHENPLPLVNCLHRSGHGGFGFGFRGQGLLSLDLEEQLLVVGLETAEPRRFALDGNKETFQDVNYSLRKTGREVELV
jgi:hypothetical protein